MGIGLYHFKNILFLFAITLTFQNTFASEKRDPVLSRYFVPGSDRSLIDRVARRFELIERGSDGFQVLVPATQAKRLFEVAPQAKLLDYNISPLKARWGDQYHDFQTVQSDLESVADRYKNLASLTTYGKSVEGRPLYVLKVTNNVTADIGKKPEIMITGATHGNELITVEVVFGILHSLVDNYGKPGQDRMTQLLNTHVIYFIPVVNPDGYVRESRYANGIDPNRDYPWPQDPNRHSNAAIFNEVNFFHQHNIKGSIDFHSFGRLIMYPWAYTEEEVEPTDKAKFETVTSQMASTNHYANGQISHILYVAEGSSADYYYWKNRTLALGIEIGDTFVPDPSEIDSNIQDNLESTWIFLESIQ